MNNSNLENTNASITNKTAQLAVNKLSNVSSTVTSSITTFTTTSNSSVGNSSQSSFPENKVPPPGVYDPFMPPGPRPGMMPPYDQFGPGPYGGPPPFGPRGPPGPFGPGPPGHFGPHPHGPFGPGPPGPRPFGPGPGPFGPAPGPFGPGPHGPGPHGPGPFGPPPRMPPYMAPPPGPMPFGGPGQPQGMYDPNVPVSNPIVAPVPAPTPTIVPPPTVVKAKPAVTVVTATKKVQEANVISKPAVIFKKDSTKEAQDVKTEVFTIMVGNIPSKLSVTDLSWILKTCGELIRFENPKNISTSFGMADYKNLEDALSAIRNLDGLQILDSKLKVTGVNLKIDLKKKFYKESNRWKDAQVRLEICNIMKKLSLFPPSESG